MSPLSPRMLRHSVPSTFLLALLLSRPLAIHYQTKAVRAQLLNGG